MRCPISLILNTLIAAAMLFLAMPGNKPEHGSEAEGQAAKTARPESKQPVGEAKGPTSPTQKERPFIWTSQDRPAGE